MIRVWVIVLALLCASGANAQDHEDELVPHDVYRHIQSPATPVRTAWQPAPALVQQVWREGWTVRVSVNTEGAVTAASVSDGPSDQRDEAAAAAQQMRFSPFYRNGMPIAVEVDMPVEARPADYTGPADRTFPSSIDPSTSRIRMERTSCYGSCPSYSIEVTGDGNVRYEGEGFVLITGEQTWRVPRESVEELVELMRRADYFLEGYYVLPVTDLPTYITALDIGDQSKFILNYGWSGMGQAAASTSFGERLGPRMPASVTEIEEAIDRLTGVQRFVRGDDTTMTALRQGGFDFHSNQAGQAFGFALSNCDMLLAGDLLDAGAPISVLRDGGPTPAVLLAPGCGDVTFAEALIARAPLRGEIAAQFLQASAASGFPDMVRLALRYSRVVNQHSERDYPPLMEAVDATDPREFDADRVLPTRFDTAETVALLLAAGANPRFRDDLMGWTALHITNDAAVVRLLIEAGARVNARDSEGRTPLFGQYDAAAIAALIAAGGDVRARDGRGRTPLHEAGGSDAVPVLIAAGADVNAQDAEGRTPLETANGEEVAQAILNAGARLPDDRGRMATLLRRASDWASLLPAFEAHARALGVQVEVQP